MHWTIYLLTLALVAFALFLLHRVGLLKSTSATLVSVLLLLLAFGARLTVFDAVNTDYEWFLGPWVQHFRDHGGFGGFHLPVGNYNVPYLYFLAFFSYIPLPDLHLIKLLSTFFDLVLAYYVMKIVGLYVPGEMRRRIAFFATLFLPTVFLNSAYWGQCDGIYAAFVVMSFYYVMDDRPALSMVTLALALSFKLQAVFLFPLYLVFLYGKKLSFRHLPIFPLTYLLSILPAVFLGRPFLETLLFYATRPPHAGLSYNAPSIFAFYQGGHYNATLALVGLFFAFLFVFFIYVLVLVREDALLSNEGYLTLALIFAVGVPLLLPHMHDRYFYMADVFAVMLGLARLRYLVAIPLTQFASLLGYHTFLHHFADPPLQIPFIHFRMMHYGAAALLILLAYLVLNLLLRRHSSLVG